MGNLAGFCKKTKLFTNYAFVRQKTWKDYQRCLENQNFFGINVKTQDGTKMFVEDNFDTESNAMYRIFTSHSDAVVYATKIVKTTGISSPDISVIPFSYEYLTEAIPILKNLGVACKFKISIGVSAYDAGRLLLVDELWNSDIRSSM